MIGHPQDIIAYLLDQPHEKMFECKEKRRRRSLTANSYYWTLLNQLARTLGIPDEEVHRNMVTTWGVGEAVSIAKEVPVDQYFKYYKIYKVGPTFQHVMVFKGSSQMDSGEFSRLLNGLIEECEAQGICTLTPQEIAALPYDGPGKGC